jgi:beta-lactamase regulating signal transducer with metallopeptidase domain
MDMSFFAEMAWKSALIAGAALMLAMMLRSRAAADRAMVLKLGVALLLALPLIVLFAPALEIVAFAAPAAPPAFAAAPMTEWQLAALTGELSPAPEPTIWDDPTPLILLAWLGGLAMIGARLLAGLWTLGRWTRGARDVTCPQWLAAFDRVRWQAGDPESIRLMVADEVRSPLSWGWRRPVILIDPDTLDEPEDAEAILAHEVAHIARGDWPVLMLARAVKALFWFNPLVWMLEREIVQQAEEAADLEAAERIDPARYAETLLSWARFNTMVPANSIAPRGSALGRRVRAILDRRSRERPAGSALTGIAMVLCLAIAAPVAAAKLVAATQEEPEAPPAPRAPNAPRPPLALAAAPAPPEAPAVPEAPEAAEAPEAPTMIHVRIPPIPPVPPIPDVGPIVRDAMAVAMPAIPVALASVNVAVDPAHIEEALRRAEAEMRRGGHSRAEIEAAMARARRDMTRVRAVRRVEIAAAMREAERAMAESRHTMRISMAHGADGMERGANQMEQGAERMVRAGERLRTDRAYREEKIAEARRRGETVTHEDLIEAGQGMIEGARGMREGAREMRQAAARMRAGRS